MLIQITDDCRVTSTPNGWRLEGQVMGAWLPMGHYRRLNEALYTAADRLLRESEAIDYDGALNAIGQAYDALYEGIDEMVRGLERNAAAIPKEAASYEQKTVTLYESYAGQRFAVFYSELIDHPTFTSMTGCAQALLIRFHYCPIKTKNLLRIG